MLTELIMGNENNGLNFQRSLSLRMNKFQAHNFANANANASDTARGRRVQRARGTKFNSSRTNIQ